ncbi:MAG: isocitrate lyase/phosphoenolpyruvate mutase family protein [Nocardia sp.]|nr:isocitrate lyase/phosphoenolpyruvate mutase family protein [Nocardia sp.]
MTGLAERSADLRARHLGGDPLILANVWDAASARAVVAAGHPVVATSSAAVGAASGAGDHEQMTPHTAFEAITRIAAAVDVPVTADLEAGYGLPAAELVERLLEAGAVGCNIEDSDHGGELPLRDPRRQADYIAQICEAGRRSGVEVVVNARVDVYVRRAVPQEERLAEAIRRGRRYLDAGATCVYPIGVTDSATIAELVAGMDGPVNTWLHPAGPPMADLRALGVARISLASALHRHAMARITALAEALLNDADDWIRTG